MIEVKDLSKRYGPHLAVDRMSFRIGRGEIVGFLGPNGAGKSTTMRILTGYIPASAGQVNISGFDVFSQSLEIRRRIGYLPENVPLYGEMRVHEYLDFRATLKGLRGGRRRRAVYDALETCGLEPSRKRIIDQLSKGFRQRVGLADALLGSPELLILDEPGMGLDPNQQREIRELIKGLAKNHTVLLSTHLLGEVEQVCQRVLIVNKGRIVANDTPTNLMDEVDTPIVVRLEVCGPKHEITETLEALPEVREVTGIASHDEDWETFTLSCETDSEIRAKIFRVITEKGWDIREFRPDRSRLEDAFVEIVRRAEAKDDA